MNTSKSEDSPSIATLFGRVIAPFLPIPLLSFGWASVVLEACALLWKAGSTFSDGDVGQLVTLTWNMWVGFFIGIQLGANIFSRLQLKRRRRNRRQFALTLLSAFCLLGTIFFNDEIFTAFKSDNFVPKIWDLLVIIIILAPVVAWFSVNLMRSVKKDIPPELFASP